MYCEIIAITWDKGQSYTWRLCVRDTQRVICEGKAPLPTKGEAFTAWLEIERIILTEPIEVRGLLE